MLQWESPTGRVSALILDTSHDWTVFSKANGAGMSTKSPYPPFFVVVVNMDRKDTDHAALYLDSLPFGTALPC